MALSYFSNWDTLPLPNHSEMGISLFQEQQRHQQDQELYVPDNFSSFDCIDSPYLDPLVEPFIESEQSLVLSEALTTLFSPPSTESISPQDLEPFHCSKRQKLNHGYANFEPNFFNGDFPAYPIDIPVSFPAPVLPEFQVPVAFDAGSNDFYGSLSRKQPDNQVEYNKPVSAQSIAARERRRRITEKTQELAKLIPSGQKMNTAEMFHAAAKYVKFLQAQIGILQLTASKEKESGSAQDQFLMLLASQSIQEKLASEAKCLVPRKFVENLASDRKIQNNPSVYEEVKELLRTDE